MTLVEIAVVLAVVALLAALGLPSLRGWREATDLRDAAGRISETMQASRMKAIVERTMYTVSVDYAADTASAAPTGGTTAKIGSVDLYADDTDPDCPSLSAQNVVFRPNGTADAAGFEAIYLRSRSARVPVRYRVKVLGATGKISTERWLGGAWVGAF